MVRCDTPEGIAERSQQHQRWLAMQTAYRKHRQTSALAHSLADDLSNEAASLDNAIKFQAAVRDQRAAFEDYIEARFQFLEFSCDRNHHAANSAGLKRRRFVCAVAAITVGLTSFDILCLSWARRHAADLNTLTQETNQIMKESRQSLQVISEGYTPNLAAPKNPRTGAKHTPDAPKQSHRPSGAVRRPIARLVGAGRYAYSEFSVAISRRSTRIGLIRISARSAGGPARRANLCVASGTATFCKTGVAPGEWLAFSLGDQRRGFELRVTRISQARVQGYFRTLDTRPALSVNSFRTR